MYRLSDGTSLCLNYCHHLIGIAPADVLFRRFHHYPDNRLHARLAHQGLPLFRNQFDSFQHRGQQSHKPSVLRRRLLGVGERMTPDEQGLQQNRCRSQPSQLHAHMFFMLFPCVGYK